jgi:glutamyl-tRNA reductase
MPVPSERFERKFPEVARRERGTRLEARFTTHDIDKAQIEICERNRDLALDLARHLNAYCPRSDELANALDRLDEVVMWANAAVAREGR